jgi:hypothetical protein
MWHGKIACAAINQAAPAELRRRHLNQHQPNDHFFLRMNDHFFPDTIGGCAIVLIHPPFRRARAPFQSCETTYARATKLKYLVQERFCAAKGGWCCRSGLRGSKVGIQMRSRSKERRSQGRGAPATLQIIRIPP